MIDLAPAVTVVVDILQLANNQGSSQATNLIYYFLLCLFVNKLITGATPQIKTSMGGRSWSIEEEKKEE